MIEEQTITIRKQIVAPRTVIEWDSASGSGFVRFETQKEVSHDGVVVAYEPSGIEPITIPISDVMLLTLDVGETQVPMPLVMAAVKAAFEHFLAARLSQ